MPVRSGTFWRVTADGVQGDLTQAAVRREWLRKTFKLKDKGLLTVTDLFETQGSDGLSVKEMGRLAFVFGDELDKEGHDDQLKIIGHRRPPGALRTGDPACYDQAASARSSS